MAYEALAKEITKAQSDMELQAALKRSVENFLNSVNKVLNRFPEISEIAEYVKTVKEKVLENLEYYIGKTITNIKTTGAHAYFAESSKEVLEIVDRIIGERPKIIVKAKSMVSEEVELREHLVEKGHEVYETDLGEFLIQITKGKPMHVIVPALHLSKGHVARLFSHHLGLPLDGDATYEELVHCFRKYFREKFIKADIGISGANAIAADTGSVLLVHNEGNISNVVTLPPVHIVVASIEKIMPTFRDAFLQIMVQSAYAGLYPPTYVNIVSGVSSTADIEYHRVYGVHGSQEVHVILYNGGRVNSSRDPLLREQLYCVKCGRCQISCPIWNICGNIWGGKVYGGPMGVGWTAVTEGLEKAESLSWFCLLCNACKEVCPVKVDSAEISRRIRMRSIEKGVTPVKVKEILENIYKYSNAFGLPREKRDEWADAKVPRYRPGVQVLYYVGDMGSYNPRAQEAAKALVEILLKANVSFGILGVNENCSGSEAYEIGEAGLFEEITQSNVKALKKLNVKEIVTLSPHSYNVMKNFYKNYGGNFTVKHYTQFICELIAKGKLKFQDSKTEKVVAFHDPCFLGRWNNEYEAPRKVLNAIPGVKLVEMERSRQNSLCCGGGCGNSYTGFGYGLLLENEASPNRIRIKEAVDVGAEILAVACPSCLIMLEEAVKGENLENKISVKDIAEITIQALKTPQI
ncbi:MAG: LUD domain-containing protein [Candidatus Bathyarchaeia archaeon]